MGGKLVRVSEELIKEMEKLRDKKKLLINEKGQLLTFPKITKLIPKHKSWPQIRDDILNFHWEKNNAK